MASAARAKPVRVSGSRFGSVPSVLRARRGSVASVTKKENARRRQAARMPNATATRESQLRGDSIQTVVTEVTERAARVTEFTEQDHRGPPAIAAAPLRRAAAFSGAIIGDSEPIGPRVDSNQMRASERRRREAGALLWPGIGSAISAPSCETRPKPFYRRPLRAPSKTAAVRHAQDPASRAIRPLFSHGKSTA